LVKGEWDVRDVTATRKEERKGEGEDGRGESKRDEQGRKSQTNRSLLTMRARSYIELCGATNAERF